MSKLILENVNIDFPIFNASGRRLTNQLLRTATGGQVGKGDSGKVHVRALEGLFLDLSSGSSLGLVGHNGAGKSTLLRLLAGIYEPTSGKIVRDGRVTSLTEIGIGISPELSGRDNILIRGVVMGLSLKDIRTKMDEIIDFSELGEFIDLPVRTYSTGMSLRLAFAVSTVTQPEILVMDEWLSVGDESFQHKAEARIQKIVDESDILVLASHSRGLIERTCNEVLWLEHGTIKMLGPTDEVLNQYFGTE